MTAAENYAMHREKARAYLAALQAYIERPAASVDWGDAGTMEHISIRLHELVDADGADAAANARARR